MKLMHLCLCGPYSDDYEYQDNLLPRKHHELGYEVKVLVSQDTWEKDGVQGRRPPQTYQCKEGYTITVLPYARRKDAAKYRYFDGLYFEINAFHPDIIFCHGGLTLSYGEIIRYCKENPNVRLYMDSHIDYNISGIIQRKGVQRIKRLLMYRFVWGHCVRSLARYAKKVWGVTPARVDFLNDVYNVDKEKTDLLVMGADEKTIDFSRTEEDKQWLREKCCLSSSALIIVSGGKFDKYKNIVNLIKAVKELESYPIHLALFGKPAKDIEDEMMEAIADAPNVTDLGWADADETTRILLGADLAIYPGRHSVLWEKTVACGTPCLIRNAPGMNHVDVGGNVAFFDGDDVESIKNAIMGLISVPQKITEMRLVAIEKGRKAFSYAEIAKRAIEMEKYDEN